MYSKVSRSKSRETFFMLLCTVIPNTGYFNTLNLLIKKKMYERAYDEKSYFLTAINHNSCICIL